MFRLVWEDSAQDHGLSTEIHVFRIVYVGPKEQLEVYSEDWRGDTRVSRERIFSIPFAATKVIKRVDSNLTVVDEPSTHKELRFRIAVHNLTSVLPGEKNAFVELAWGRVDGKTPALSRRAVFHAAAFAAEGNRQRALVPNGATASDSGDLLLIEESRVTESGRVRSVLKLRFADS